MRCRLAHITDLHLQRDPAPAEWLSKRLIGGANLYLLGRRAHFQERTVDALIRAVEDQAPDALICSGDLTALATAAEFDLARDRLGPLFSRQPSLLIPGNHDVYAAGSGGRLQATFPDACRGDGAGVLPGITAGGMRIVGLDVCFADWASRGRAGAGLERLRQELAAGAEPLGLMIHYPLRDRRGQPYGPWTRALIDAPEVERLLDHPRAAAVFHGHEHHGYTTAIPLGPAGDRRIQSLNPGAGGYAHLPAKSPGGRDRTAHFCVYTVDSGAITGVERFAYDGERFIPEAGGAWASGG